jgi:methionyl-tRNA synthetase
MTSLIERDGLQDFSISRLKSKMSWGVPVPDDDGQVMYVWFDALVNYISTLGWPENEQKFNEFWVNGETLQMAGKDQVRQQAVMWQAMLMSADLPTTKQIFIHGFINSGGQKMSKSLGNVIDPMEIVSEYGTDALRYFLLREVHPFEDSDFTIERFKDAYNANLANGIGNLTSRIMKMAEDNLDGPVEIPEHTIMDDYFALLNKFEFNRAMDYIWAKIAELDGIIQSTEPFKLVKTDREKGIEIIKDLAVRLYGIGRLLNPMMPDTSAKIKSAVKSNKMPSEPLFMRK